MLRTLFALLILALPLTASEPDSAAAAQLLRDVLVKKIPAPAIDAKSNWGHQKEIVTSYDLKRRGPFKWDATPNKEMVNDGHWTHAVIDLKDPAKNVTLELKDLKPRDSGLAFHAAVRSARVHLKVEQQIWKNGVRLLSNETRATCKAAVHLECELEQRTESKPGATLPDVIIKLKVKKADIYYDDLVVEHTLGVGGDAARIIGDAAHKLMAQVKPSIERDLVAKANAAIVKAANDKEVRLGLSNLMKK